QRSSTRLGWFRAGPADGSMRLDNRGPAAGFGIVSLRAADLLGLAGYRGRLELGAAGGAPHLRRADVLRAAAHAHVLRLSRLARERRSRGHSTVQSGCQSGRGHSLRLFRQADRAGRDLTRPPECDEAGCLACAHGPETWVRWYAD